MLRRRKADCGVLATRVEIILDDLLWILSDRQIQATLLCVKVGFKKVSIKFSSNLNPKHQNFSTEISTNHILNP